MTARYLETRDIPLSALVHYPGNARRGNADAIRDSLQANGQYRSLIVRQHDDGFTVLAGNNTLTALQQSGAEAARCELIECSDVEARKIVLADNRTSDLAVYDDTALAQLLAGYKEPADLFGTGFDADFATALLQQTGVLSDRATGFLNDLTDPGNGFPDEDGAGAPSPNGSPGGGGANLPQGNGEDYVQVHYLVTVDQRHTIHRALSAARDQHGYATAADALTAICDAYLTAL